MAEGTDEASISLLMERKTFDFPPYTRIIELTIKDKFEDRAERMSGRLADVLGKEFNTSSIGNFLAAQTVTPPYRPAVDRIEDLHIRKIRVCFKKDRMLSSNKSSLRELIALFEKENKYPDHITVDVDPA